MCVNLPKFEIQAKTKLCIKPLANDWMTAYWAGS